MRELRQKLSADGIDVWLDEEKLLPGQLWEGEISKAVQSADVVIVCLSKKSVSKEGFIQKEISYALDKAEEKPEGTIFLIPARIMKCSVPARLGRWQWVNLFDDQGYDKLLQALRLRAAAVGITIESTSKKQQNNLNEFREENLGISGDELKYVYSPPLSWKKWDIFINEDTWLFTSGDNVTHLYIEHWSTIDKFLWNIESREGSGHWTKLSSVFNPSSYFCLSICGRKVYSPTNSEYGILFGYADNDNFYDFQIADDKSYFVWHKVNGKYILLKKRGNKINIFS